MPASSTLSPVSVDPCFFPRMVGHPNKGNGGYQTVTVSRPSQREITEFCVKRRVPMEHVVAAAWSLTLREYVGSETVAFAFRDRVNLAPQLVGAKMESSAWLTELVDSFKKDSPHNTTCEVYTQDLLPALHSNINTAVLWDDSKESGNGRSSVSDGLLDTSEYAVSVQIPHLELRYNRSHLEDLDADNVANALSQAIAKIVKSESPTTLRDVSLLGEEGMKQIKQWNANMPDLWPVRIEEIIYQLVLEQPNSPAVHAWDGHYTYAELDRAADGFANYLRKLGVKPGMIVPFCFPKSSWAVVAVLAILKAGGAAAALDPNYPSERLRQIMEQTGATIIVGHSGVLQKLEDLAFCKQVIAIDDCFQRKADASNLESPWTGPVTVTTPADPAFVVFTSGSTGNSKGIVISHQSLCTSAFAHGAFMGLSRHSRVLQFAAYTFDVSNQDIWSTLMHGGCVCVPTDEERLNDLAGAINRMAVNWTFLTPTVARLLTPDLVPTLQTLVLGGEAVTKDNVDTWAPFVRLLNSYGPAECSICCAVSELSPSPSPRTRHNDRLQTEAIDPANIGYALPSAVLWVVHPQNHNILSAIGAVGELLVEGPILADGYLGNSSLTEAAFIKAPEWASPAGHQRRFYKTGDLVQYANDGTLRFVGRKDHQVKIHGQRTEPGDIEHHVSGVAAVQHACIILPQRGHWSQRLVAVISLTQLRGIAGHETGSLRLIGPEHQKTVRTVLQTLRTVLLEKLPSYMIPAVWLVVNNLPLSPSAKVDRKQILRWAEEMGEDFRHLAADFVSATDAEGEVEVHEVSETESVLQQIYSQVLNIPLERVKRHGSFISFGGDSISAMQVMGEARAKGLVITVQEILTVDSIVHLGSLARAVEDIPRNQSELVVEDSSALFDLAPMQIQHFELAPDGDPSFLQGFLLSVPHAVTVDALTSSITTLVGRHEMLRARFIQSQNDGLWRQHIIDDCAAAFELRVHHVRDTGRLKMAVQRIQADLDLSSGPLFSVDLFNVRGHGQYLYLLAHQLIVDLVSWRIILQELEELLRLGQLNRPTPLPFSAWCRLQVDQAEGFLHHDTLLPFPLPQSDISYWGLESTGQSPTYGSAVEKTFRLEAGVSDLLLHQCPKALRVEPVDQFLSCLATSFGEAFTDRNIPTIFLESHGREPWTSDIDLSRTVGWFTTIAPVPVREACRDLHPFTVTEDINRTRKSLPDKGWAWWTAQFLSPTVGEKPHTRNSMEILFNYEGIYHILEREDSWLQHGPPEIAPIIPGTRRLSLATSKSKFRSDSVKLLSVFEVTAAVTASRLEFSFIYPANTCHLDRIHEWIAGFEAALVSTANRLATSQGSSLFPSLPSPGPRFPLSNYGDRDIEDLEKVLHQAGVDGLSAVEDIYSCSPMQEALLLSRLSDRADIYVLHYVWKLLPSDKAGEVDMGRLSTAWQAVVDRHPALRTIFVAAPNGHLDQVVLQIRQAHVHQETLGNLSEQDVALADLSLQTADQSIPQYNLTLVRTSNGEQFLKFAVSHTIFDGESAPVLAHEICAAYDNALHELPVPYSGLIAYLAERKPGPSLVFWKEKLSQAKPCQFPRLTNIENSTDKRPVPSHELVSRQPTIPLGTLQERCAQAGMTLSTLFLTVWALTLRVYTGQDSVCFGFLASGRDAPIAGVEKIIGPVLNMLICHVVFRLGITPRSLASKIQRDFLESLSHQFISLAEIQHELGLGQSSLFNSCISYQRSQKLPHVPGRTFQLERIGGQSKTEFDIMLNINVTDEDVTVVFKYWTSRLMRPDAIRVADTFDHILASVLDRLDTPLEQVNLLSVNDRLEITKWNDQEVMNAKKCVHTLVKHNAVERPDAIAIRSWDGDWTYAELDSAARTLSYELHDFGVGPEVVVPILAQRSVWAIIGALAVLKAGGACVSVRQDSANFSSDLKQSLSTFAVKVILAGPEFVDSAKELVPHVIPLGRTVKGVLHDGERAWNLATPENLSFVVWTTGWAGRPRAVLLDHKCVCSGALTQGSVLGLEGSSSVLQYSPLDDRMSVTEIWTTLILGGCVCIPRPGLSLSNILDTINGKHVTWACLPPTIAAALDCKSAPSLKTLVLTGEFASRRDLDRWKEVRLVYSYSTAEVGICAATVVTTSLINAAHIGRAVGNVKLWVTDPHRHDILCPIGAVGELVVEGSILPRGYGSSSASSSSAFVRGPAWTTRFPALDNDGERRIFKTGDLVKYGEDGTLRYISKKDHLASACSLERNLLLLPDIGRVAVVRALSGPLSEHLVAFYIPYGVQYSIDSMKVQLCKPDQVLQMQTLHRKFQDHLEAESDERVQVYFVPVQGIPLLSNGKINRKLLQGWLEDNDEEVYQRVYALNGTSQPQTIEPADQTEAAVAQIWSEVLSIPKDRIGRDVPFYNLGGDSISAIQAASRARRVNINLTAQDILQFRTVARIAPVVARREKAAVKTAHDADNEILEFDISPIQTLYFDADPDGSACYYQSIYLALRRPVASEIISPALRSLIQRHSMLRSRFQCIEGAWVQSISDDVQASFSLATVHNPSDDHIRDIIAERLKTINISSGPLVTALLFDDLPDRRQRFFLAAHHLVIDHVSWRVILGELEEAISGHITIGPEPFPYPKWSQSLRRFSMENFRNTRKTLPFDVPPIDLSFWGVTGDKNSHGQIQQQGFTLDEAMTECLLTRSQDLLRSEPIEVMLGAALHAFVRVFPDRGLPAMFNESHGRDALGDLCDISQTVGWFTTMAPVASSVGSSVLDTVRRVKDARHQLLRGGWPYFASRYLTPEGQASFGGHFPMEIILNYLGRYHIFEQGDGLFARLPAPDLPCLYPDLKRFSLFEILVTVDIGQLEVKFLYPQDIKHQSRIEEWIQQYRILLEEAFTGTEPLLSLNDFPLLSMGYEDLDRLAKEILPTIRGPATLTNLEELYPCTPIQSGLLVSQARNPAYYEYATIAEVYPPAAGQLVDAKRLARAWQELVRRHSILRTVFVESLSPDRLYDQAVLRDWNGEVMYPQVDSRDPTAILEDLPGIEFAPGHSLHRLAICVAENGAVFVRLDMNHAISDGASTSILFRDLALAYHGKLVGSPLSQYRDFVSFLLQDDKQKHLAYWVDRLSGAEPCLLPLSVHSEGPSNEIEFTRVSLPKPVSQLRTFCIRNGVTLSTLLQAAWAMVLRIYCDSDRVCFGYLVSGRDVPIVGVENVIGPFLNILVCQLAFDLHSSPDTTMHSIQNQFVEGLPHQFCPLADILHKLNLGDQRLFNTAFSFQRPSTSSRTDRDPLITFRRQRARDPTEFDVTIDVEESGDRLEVVLEHWAQRISSSLASHLADTFTAAILAILESPKLDLRLIDLTGPKSLSQIHRWNARPYPINDVCIHHAFEAQARRYPNAEAVCSFDGALSYAELDTLASNLAGELIAHGVTRGVLVPFILSKSYRAVVGILAILKAGGAGVPLDSRAPHHRLQTIVSDTKARVILCSSEFQHSASAIVSAVVVVDAVLADREHPRSHQLQDPSRPSDPAFVIFTSGSTGTPKGSILEHGSLSTSALSLQPVLNMHSGSRVLHFASYTFDVSIEEVCFTLMHGACICVVSEAERMDDLGSAMRRLGVTWAELTPTVAAMISPGDVPSLQTLVVRGEIPSQSVISSWALKVQLINTYGPSECSVTCTATDPLTPKAHGAHIGFPVGCRAWIVNPQTSSGLVPVGAVGELVVEGRIVARGYLSNPALSKARFLSSAPWLPDDAAGPSSLYLTGDLVRYSDDGSLTFVGRRDGQAKLHGQRLEVGEIEYQVAVNAPQADQVAVDVLPISGIASRKALVAFLALRIGDARNEHQYILPVTDAIRDLLGEVKAGLAQTLPSYMIPSFYIPLSHLPQNLSGKTDRKALASLAVDFSETQWLSFSLSGSFKRPPATEPQRQLQQLWSDILGLSLSAIGQDDHFFQVGGDSVFAIHLSAAARKLGLSLPVGKIFQYPTLASMAAVLQHSGNACSKPTLPEHSPYELVALDVSPDILRSQIAQAHRLHTKILDIYPCTPLQEGLFALTLRSPRNYVSRRIYLLPSSLDIGRFKVAWQQVVSRIHILRTRISFALSNRAYQFIVPEEPSWSFAESLPNYLADDDARPFSEGKPLSRYAIVHDRENDYFVWTIHHALYDGWSDALVWQLLTSLYHQLPAPFSVVPFHHFVQHLSSQNSDASDAFWTSYLSGTITAPFPSCASSLPSEQRPSVQTLNFSLTGLPTRQANLATLLKAAWALVVAQYTNCADVVFGVTLSGRDIDLAGIETVAGPTIATVPFRVAISKEISISEFIARLQSDTVSMINHQHVGLQHIRALGDDARSACGFQNLLIIQPRALQTLEDSSLNLIEVPEEPRNFTGYPLVLECTLSSEKVLLQATHDVNALSIEQARRILQQMSTVLHGLLTIPPEKAVREALRFNTYDEDLVTKWNSQPFVTVDRCVHHLILEHRLLTPTKEAVRAWDASLTFQELDGRSNRLAISLIQCGVVPGKPVGFSLPRSSWSVVVLLAILKAGGVFVFIDAKDSDERLEQIIGATGMSLVVTQNDAFPRFTSLGLSPLSLSTGLTIAPAPDSQSPLPELAATSPAYIIFTSGSTGIPKGVVVSHAALSSSLTAHGGAMGIATGSRMLHYSSYSFDISVMEIFTTLALGGCVCVPGEDDRMANLESAMQTLQVNMAILTPTVARLLKPEEVPGLKTLYLIGEAPHAQDVAKWANQITLMNTYGPAEATLIASVHAVFPGDDPRDIGSSLTGDNLWIADADNHHILAPVGAIGELLIEGPILADGYLADPQKTSSSFISDPQWCRRINPHKLAHRRFYKTGDLVRYNDAGSILYVGRKDTQIKINGQRIELGEIEHRIQRALPIPFDFVVGTLSAEEHPDKQEVVIYFRPLGWEPDQGSTTTATPQLLQPTDHTALVDVRNILLQHMDPHLVPTLFFPVSFIPMNKNGKVDRMVLHRLAASVSLPERPKFTVRQYANPELPMTVAERALQKAWSRVLGIAHDQISANDSFIQLGGNSLTAIRLVAAAREARLVLAVKDVFSYPRLSDMARRAEDKLNDVEFPSESSITEPFSLIANKDNLDAWLEELESIWDIPQHMVADAYPTTPLQEGLLAVSMRLPGSYVTKEAYRLPENIDLDRFASALQTLVVRHPILRTRLVPATSEGTCQVVVKEHAVQRITVESFEAHIDITADQGIGKLGKPLAELAVLEESTTGRAFLLWNAHHSVYDAWMTDLLWADLDDLYHARHIPDTIPPFAAFVAYVQSVQTPDTDDYWRQYLANVTPTVLANLPSPSHHPRASQSLHKTFVLPFELPSNITLATIIRAAWAILLFLYRGTGDSDVVFPVTQSGRNAPVNGITKIVGPTITTFPLRVRWKADTKVSQLLGDLQDAVLDLIPYEQAGLQHIRELGHDCQVACDSDNLLVIHTQSPESETPLRWRKMEVGCETNFLSYALTVECTMDDRGIHTRASYDPGVIPSYQINRILHQFEFLIDQLCQSDPDRPVGDLEAFSPNDLREIRALHPENIPSVETSFPAIFAEQVARNPEALAVDSQHGVKLTYAELDRLSDGLARYLISLGLMPQDKVGWCSEKTPWTVVGIVAIAKAGGIFMFLDPSHPPSRRAEILQTGQPRLILAISPHDGLFQYPDAQPVDAVVLVDERLLTELRDQKHGALPDSLQPDSGLYIQFTSGSTGTPKGCLVEHSNFLSSAAIYTHRTNLTQQSRVFQVSSYNFDSSILEMLASLTVGACVCVPREEARSDDDLPGTMNDLAVTWALITPSLARTLLATSVPSLQDLVLAGEALSEVDVKTWAASVRLYNGYGPAECAILTTVNRIVNTDVAPNELGKPLASANWIVCPQDPNKLAPLGAVGELLIEGSIVGRGYLNDSHRTVASFIRPPRWLEQYHSAARSSQKHRVYLTGDLVRYTRDGSISYVGRKDLQVKIRGQRVELGEIEHRLWTHSLVNNAVVVYPTSGRCSRQLVGFLALTRVTSFAQNPDDVTLLPNHVLPTITEDVRIIENSLSSQLPSYMIPTVWVPLSSIPLLVSGKSNRRILLNWLAGLDEPTFTMIVNLGQNESTETRPWSQTEETLRTIWGKVLNLPFERIHLNSSFLRLGGNSISAMQVAGLARKANVDFPLTAVLGSSSLKELATSARAIPKISRAKAPSLVGVPFALSPMQQFYAQVALGEDELSLTTNRQFHYSFPFRLTSHTTVSQLDEAIQRIVKRHPMLRARFQRQQRGNERHSQMITNEVFTSYRLQTHQSSALEDTRSALDASRVSLDIYSGPLLAADLVETETDQVLFFTIHHLVTDMVSWNVILGDLEDFLSRGEFRYAEEESYPFQHWCKLQEQHAQMLDPASVLPFSVPPADFDYWQMEHETNLLQDLVGEEIALDKDQTAKLLDTNDRVDVQDFIIAALLRSFVMVFDDRCPPTVFRYDHGRRPEGQEIDLSRTVGWLTTVTPVTVPVKAHDSLSTIVHRTHAVRSSIPGSGWPYFISRYLTEDGAAAFQSHNRIEVLLNYLGSGLHGQATTPVKTRLERFQAFSDSTEGGLGARGQPVRRFALFGVQVQLLDSRLIIQFEYNRRMKHQDGILRWISALRGLLDEDILLE